MKTKTIRQTITFKAMPKEVYEMIMDKKKHSEITDSEVVMTKKINGKFSTFGGYCTGYNVELVDGEKIVQGWRFDEDGWPEDHYSTCTFLFTHVDNGTKLIFEQKGVPEHKYEAIKKGWHKYYWSPMKKFIDDHRHVL